MQPQPVTQQELDHLHAAWESQPNSRSFAPLADAYHRAGRHEEAIELLQTGTARHPDYLSALVLLADCYEALGRGEEADAIFARVLSQESENVRALEHQAEQSLRQGALGKAAGLVERLRQIDPWDATIRRLAAQLQEAPAARPAPPVMERPAPAPQGRMGAPAGVPAMPEDADAIALPDSTPDELSTLTLAQIYESQGYLQKALNIYERLLRKHPDNQQVATRLDQLRRRLSGADDSAHEAPSQPEAAHPSTTWRLLDAQSVESMRPPAAAARPARPAAAESRPQASSEAVPGDQAASRDEDFQRFLRYVRSLGR